MNEEKEETPCSATTTSKSDDTTTTKNVEKKNDDTTTSTQQKILLEEKLTTCYNKNNISKNNYDEQQNEDNISTSGNSCSSSSDDDNDDGDERMHRALSFLNNSSVSDVSHKEKEKYLLNKGFSLNDIHRATNNKQSYKKKKKGHHRDRSRRRRYVEDYNTSPEPRLQQQHPSQYGLKCDGITVTESEEQMSGTLLSAAMGAGGIIAVIAMASWRWLNGGDFEFSPPPHNATTTTRGVTDASQEEETADDISENDSESSSIADEKEIDNNHESISSTIQPESSIIISTKLDQLNDNIQKLNANFEKFLHTQTAQQHRHLTNSTIDLLRPITTTANITSIPISTNLSSEPAIPTKNPHEAIEALQKDNDTTTPSFQESIRMLYLYLNNLKQNPTISRYRKIYTLSDSFQKNIPPLKQYGMELLEMVGFMKDKTNPSWLEIQDEKEIDLDILQLILNDLSALLSSSSSNGSEKDSNNGFSSDFTATSTTTATTTPLPISPTSE